MSSSEFFQYTVPLLTLLTSQMNKTIFLMTNNSTRSRQDYHDKFTRMGLKPFDQVVSDMYCSAYAAAIYLKERFKSIKWTPNTEKKKGVFVIGMKGIRDELNNAGIESFGYEFSDKTDYKAEELLQTFREYQEKWDIKCVLVGFDTKFNMFKLGFATLCLREIPDCVYVATNTDRNLPFMGTLLPGSGTQVSSVNHSTQREPEMICGKPNTLLMDRLAKEYDLDRSSILMVGDRLETDIRMANKAGIQSLAVLTGAATKQDVENAKEMDKPTFVLPSLDFLYKALIDKD